MPAEAAVITQDRIMVMKMAASMCIKYISQLGTGIGTTFALYQFSL
jgi:hypothetical protein